MITSRKDSNQEIQDPVASEDFRTNTVSLYFYAYGHVVQMDCPPMASGNTRKMGILFTVLSPSQQLRLDVRIGARLPFPRKSLCGFRRSSSNALTSQVEALLDRASPLPSCRVVKRFDIVMRRSLESPRTTFAEHDPKSKLRAQIKGNRL